MLRNPEDDRRIDINFILLTVGGCLGFLVSLRDCERADMFVNSFTSGLFTRQALYNPEIGPPDPFRTPLHPSVRGIGVRTTAKRVFFPIGNSTETVFRVIKSSRHWIYLEILLGYCTHSKTVMNMHEICIEGKNCCINSKPELQNPSEHPATPGFQINASFLLCRFDPVLLSHCPP